jgi:hypothetical protein
MILYGANIQFVSLFEPEVAPLNFPPRQLQPPHFTTPRASDRAGLSCTEYNVQLPRVQTAFRAIVSSPKISTLLCIALNIAREQTLLPFNPGWFNSTQAPSHHHNNHNVASKAETYSQQHIFTGFGQSAKDRSHDQCV